MTDRKEYMRAYSAEWRATHADDIKAYRKSERGKAAIARHEASAKRKATWAAYEASSERKAGLAAKVERHKKRIAAARADGCVDCGATENLHFHHVDPATKSYTIGSMSGHADPAFYAELAKCVVVCRPCHTARHNAMRTKL